MDIFQILFYQPTFNLIVWLTGIFGNIGWAIIIVAFLAKIITIPLTKKQIKNAEKSTQLQIKMKELKKKYKNNQQKLTEETAKLQATALPGQLGGCLSIIIFLILFIQVRGVILDLVNKGYYAYNKVAYSISEQKKADYVKVDLPEGFSDGDHSLSLAIATDNGNQLSKTYNFSVTTDLAAKKAEVIAQYNALNDEEKTTAKTAAESLTTAERAQDFGVYNVTFDSSYYTLTTAQFLIFTTDSTSAYILTDNTPDPTFYLRTPSGQVLDYSTLVVTVDGKVITDNVTYQKGDELNLNFAGVNLSRVASDFGLFNLAITWPYILISILSGITQYFVTKLYSANNAAAAPLPETENKKDDKKKGKKKEEPEEPDFAEAMAQSSKQMNMLFPIMTVMMSLGYLGGSTFIPMGVTLFWTAQNTFVIIQQMISQRKKVAGQISKVWQNVRAKFQKPTIKQG